MSGVGTLRLPNLYFYTCILIPFLSKLTSPVTLKEVMTTLDERTQTVFVLYRILTFVSPSTMTKTERGPKQ